MAFCLTWIFLQILQLCIFWKKIIVGLATYSQSFSEFIWPFLVDKQSDLSFILHYYPKSFFFNAGMVNHQFIVFMMIFQKCNFLALKRYYCKLCFFFFFHFLYCFLLCFSCQTLISTYNFADCMVRVHPRKWRYHFCTKRLVPSSP